MILSLSIATIVMGTTGLSFVFAGGDKCKDNGDNNCNDTHKSQELKSKVECKNEIEPKDSDGSTNEASTSCQVNSANVKDVENAVTGFINPF